MDYNSNSLLIKSKKKNFIFQINKKMFILLLVTVSQPNPVYPGKHWQVNALVPTGTHLKTRHILSKSSWLHSPSYVPPFLHLSGTKLQTVLPVYTYKIRIDPSENNTITNLRSIVDRWVLYKIVDIYKKVHYSVTCTWNINKQFIDKTTD